MIKNWPQDERSKITNRDLILLAQEVAYSKNTKELFDDYMRISVKQYSMYKRLVDHGVSREMARIGLPLNMYTEFYWCIDLHNLLLMPIQFQRF